MKILFMMKHAGAVRNFESVLSLLAERGHQLHVAFEKGKKKYDPEGHTGLINSLSQRYPNVTYGSAPRRDEKHWSVVARELRLSIDYLRYLEPRYRNATKLRERAEPRASAFVRRITKWPLIRSPLGLKLLSQVLRIFEQGVPNSKAVDTFLQEQRPDILLVTPLVELGSSQADYIRSGKALGIRTALCVYSWDNLTNKGLIRDIPGLVTVWNEAQKEEAVELHGVPPAQVLVTGAAAYDHWFDWRPSTTREAFCQQVGLQPDRPFFLYLCSSPFIALQEAQFVEKWVRQLRQKDEKHLGEVGVLVRPHPQNAAQWRDVDLSHLGNVVVWPRHGADPVDPQSKADYYDSIYHCAAVVGVNTSALIESAIVGRPVYTLLAPEFRDTQEGTLHFHHLLNVNGGLLNVAATFEEHAAQLVAALQPDSRREGRNLRFVEAFVRPFGLDVPATPVLVNAIEAACTKPSPRPQAWPLWAQLGQLALSPFESFVHRREKQRIQRVRLLKQQSAKAPSQQQRAAAGTATKAPAQPIAHQSLLKRLVRGSLAWVLQWMPLRRVVRRYFLPSLALATATVAMELVKADYGVPVGKVKPKSRRAEAALPSRETSQADLHRALKGASSALAGAQATPGASSLKRLQSETNGRRAATGDALVPRDGAGGPAFEKATPIRDLPDAAARLSTAITAKPSLVDGQPITQSALQRPDNVGRAGHIVEKLVAKKGAPIIVGPWLGEVGFEVLYWIPFLTWAVEQYPSLAGRLVVVSRGGAGHWYRHLTSRYVDILETMSPEEYRTKREESFAEEGSKQKQVKVTKFEQQIVEDVRKRLRLKADLLHPSTIFQAVRQLAKEDAIPRVQKISRYRPMDSPPLGPLEGVLPEEYVAVRFYYNNSFPETEENRQFIRSMIDALTRTTNVVLLNTGLRFDEHWDFEGARSDRVIKIDHLMQPTNNLEVQTAAIARARAFVGTYGGLSYLPPFLQVPSFCFYSDATKFLQHHLDLAYRVFRGPEWGDFVALSIKHADAVGLGKLLDGSMVASRTG